MSEKPPKPNRYCPNCYYPLPRRAIYCQECGQKYTTGKIPVRTFINEFFSEHINLDSRIFRTIGALFFPGRLTNEYFKGRHRTYASPLRLFLVTAVLLFALVSFLTSEVAIDLGTLNVEYVQKAERERAIIMLDTLMENIREEQPSQQVGMAFDSLNTRFLADIGEHEDSMTLDYFFDQQELRMSIEDFNELTPTEVVDKYGIEDFWERILARQELRILQEGSGRNLYQFFLGKLTIMLLLMMPFLALILRMLYIRRNYYYVEHLVFSFHFHAFVFVIVGILSIVGPYMQGWQIGLTITGIFVYEFLAMKRVYKQGFFKTFLKWFVLNILFSILASIFFVLGVLISIFLF